MVSPFLSRPAVILTAVLALSSSALILPATAQQCPNSGSDCVVDPGSSLTISTSSNSYSGQTIVGLGGTLAILGGGSLTGDAGGTSDGTITIGPGGYSSFGSVFNIGSVAGTSSITVDGGAFYVNNNLFFGSAAGSNVTAVFSNGASVFSNDDQIGSAAGSTASVTLTGTGTLWNEYHQPIIGNDGTGSLTIANGAVMQAELGYFDGAFIGNGASGVGTLTVTGAGSSFTLFNNDLLVGNYGRGSLIVSNGGAVSAYSILVAVQSGSTGQIVIGSPDGQAPTAPGTISTHYIDFGLGDGSIVFNHTSDNYIFNTTLYDYGKVIVDAGTTVLTALNYYTSGTYLNGGTLSVSDDSNLGNGSSALNFNGGTLRITGTGFTSTARTINWGAGGGGFDIADPANTFEVTQQLTGTGGLTKLGAGYLTLSGANSYTGATNIAAGTLIANNATALGNGSAVTVASGASLALASDQTIGSLAGAGLVGGAGNNPYLLTLGGDNRTTVFSGALVDNVATAAGTGTSALSLDKTGTGSLTLSGVNTYTGTTTVDGGTLVVNGDISSSSQLTVNAGATLGGNGIVGDTFINDGTLAPGNSIGVLTVQGNLALTVATTYMVELSGATADRVNVSGTATLNGATVNASVASGGSVSSKYTILTATSGVVGTFNPQLAGNLSSNFKPMLSYDANDVYLNLSLNYAPASGAALSANQQVVANRLVSYFNAGGSIPVSFGSLTATGLTQASGETVTGAQQVGFDAMNQFMGIMTDPFSAGRNAPNAGAAGFAAENDALAYAPDSRKRSRAERDAYAMFVKAPPKAFEARWNMWVAGFGGARTTDGNAALGSNRTTSSIAGSAVGADYWFSPSTVAGFSMAGGGTNFSVANGGSGTSDLFQVGGYVRHAVGSAYVTGAVAYGWQDIRTDRLVTGGATDRLRAEFNANTYSVRLEGGNRWLLPSYGGIGVTPYAAVQVSAFDLPAYAENSVSGVGPFALNYAAKTTTDTRTELGFRTDKSFAVDAAVLTLRGRAAWAHDFDTDRSANATFQSLPGASFTVNGAVAAHDAALTTASAEFAWTNGWSVAATFDGEFSNVTESYSGKGVVRYAW